MFDENSHCCSLKNTDLITTKYFTFQGRQLFLYAQTVVEIRIIWKKTNMYLINFKIWLKFCGQDSLHKGWCKGSNWFVFLHLTTVRLERERNKKHNSAQFYISRIVHIDGLYVVYIFPIHCRSDQILHCAFDMQFCNGILCGRTLHDKSVGMFPYLHITLHHKNYWHSLLCVLFCFVIVKYQVISHISFRLTSLALGPIIWLPQCQWDKPEKYIYIDGMTMNWL